MKNKKKKSSFSDELAISGEKLKTLPWIFASIRVLLVANKIKLFEILSQGGKTPEEISNKLECNKDAFEKFLKACEALGLVKFENGKYINSKFSEKYLVEGSESYVGDWIAHSYDLWNEWSELESWISCKNMQDDKTWHEKLVLGLYEITINSEAKELARIINLKGRKHLLDVGGGAAGFSIAFCRRYKNLKATVFDLKESIEVARKKVIENKLEDRIFFIIGDWDRDDFGYGYDAVFMSNVLHGRESKAGMKLRKAYNAMKENGMLIVRDFLLRESRSKKLNKKASLFNLMVGAYTFDELKEEIEKAGFSGVRKLNLPEDFQPVVIAYKK